MKPTKFPGIAGSPGWTVRYIDDDAGRAVLLRQDGYSGHTLVDDPDGLPVRLPAEMRAAIVAHLTASALPLAR